jgi:hypothetical protein
MKKAVLLAGCMLAVCLLAACGGSSEETIDLIPVSNGEKYVYINNRGEVEVEPEVQVFRTSVFRGKYALAGVGDMYKLKWGYIDRTGKLVIPAKYAQATIFSEGLAWVKSEDGAFVAINETGEEVLRLSEATGVRCFREGLAPFEMKGGKWGYVDKTGKVVIEPAYGIACDFTHGLAAVEQNGVCGFINKKGETVIPMQYIDAHNFTSEGYAVVGISAGHRKVKYGVIDKKGNYVIEPEYNEMQADGNEFYVGNLEDGRPVYGYINAQGKVILPIEFVDLNRFNGSDYTGVIRYRDREGCEIIDRKGQTVAERPSGRIISSFTNGVAFVPNGMYVAQGISVINTKGETVVAKVYEVADDYLMDVPHIQAKKRNMGSDYLHYREIH